MNALQWLLVAVDGACAVHRHLLKKNCSVGRQTRDLLQGLPERQLVVEDQINPVLQQRAQNPFVLAEPKLFNRGVPEYHRDGLRLRQQPQNIFDKRGLIEAHPNHDVLPGQRGLINPTHFDCRKQHRCCRKQVCPVSLDEASRRRTNGDDQIGRSSVVEHPEIFGKFWLRRVITTPSGDDGIFLNVRQPGRLAVQFTADLPAPRGPRLEIRAIRMQEQDFFRLAGSVARLGLGDRPAD